MATFASALSDPSPGLSVAIHNVPEGISVSVPVCYATGSRRKAFFCSFLSGVSKPVGALIGCAILFRFFNDFVFGVSFAGEEVGVAASFLSDIGHLASRYVPSFDLAAKAEKER